MDDSCPPKYHVCVCVCVCVFVCTCMRMCVCACMGMGAHNRIQAISYFIYGWQFNQLVSLGKKLLYKVLHGLSLSVP